ncbi:MAG TPA: AsmA family protein [bacterium]|nr:AsmA family protein [bacterium]
MGRPWYKSRWTRAGAVVCLAVLAVAAAVPFLVPIDRVRPLVVQLLEGATGRDVQIDGLRLYVLPTLHIHAVNLRVTNPKGFPEGDALAVRSVDLGVALPALLSRRIEVTGVSLSGIRLALISGAHGRTNLDLPAPSPRAATRRGPGLLFSLGRIDRISVTDLSLTSAAIDPRRGRAIQAFALSGVSARVTSLDPSAPDWPHRLQVVVGLKGARLDVSALLKPVQFQSGEILVKGGTAQSTFAASLDTLQLTGRATMAAFDPLSVMFSLELPDVDVNRLQRLMSNGSAATVAAAPGPRRLLARGDITVNRLAFSPFEAEHVRGRLSVYTDRVAVDSYALSAYGGTVQGAAAVDYAAAGAPAFVTARAHAVDLARLVRVLASRTEVAGLVDADVRLTTALGRDPRAALSGGGTFEVGRLTVPPLTVSQVRGRLSVTGSRLRADPYGLSAYGGTVQGAAALNYADPQLPVVATAQARGVDVAALVGAVAPGPSRITGALEAAFGLATALGRDPLAALTANGTFAVRDGSFPGLDLGGRLGGLARITQALQPGASSGATSFRYVGGDLRIAAERGNSNALRLDADALSGTAHGSFGFDRTLDYTGTGVLNSQGSSGSALGLALSLAGKGLGQAIPGAAGTTGARVPFRLQGTFDDPKFSLAGTPELIRNQAQPTSPQPSQQPQLPQLPQLPGLPPNLLNIFH